jgi:GTP 3',8-cyclase
MIGIIAIVTQPFCRNCNRARLSSDGKFYTCLFGSKGTNLLGPLRDDASDWELAAIIRRIWEIRGDRYSGLRTAVGLKPRKVEMSAIGG